MQVRAMLIKTYSSHFLDEVWLFGLRLYGATGSKALIYGRSEGLRVVQ